MKKQTLEEVTERWNEKQTTLEFGKPHNAPNRIKSFIEGAKWQQERSYSEEEVIELLQKALTHQDDGEIGSLVTVQGQIRTANFYSWFEQFKKK